MELAEIVSRRPIPGAGLFAVLTPRCPLRCAHCSSASTMAGRDPDPAALTRFLGTFGATDRPDVLMLTGGEPLLMPGAVAEAAAAAARAGTRSAVLTGAFFARDGRPTPPPIRRAIAVLDHLSVSVDAYHEPEVSRADVFRLLAETLDAGVAVSLHTIASGPGDQYIDTLAAQLRSRFGRQVPMLVNTLRPVGRARHSSPVFAPAPAAVAVAAAAPAAVPAPAATGGPMPCALAAWPVVAADGEIVACCNQRVVERRPAPPHLRLGHAAVDTWAQVRERLLERPMLRMIRVVGPAYLAARSGVAEPGRCTACHHLSQHPEVIAFADRAGSGAVGALLDADAAQTLSAAGPVAFLRRYGSAAYAGLVDPTPEAVQAVRAVRPAADQNAKAAVRS